MMMEQSYPPKNFLAMIIIFFTVMAFLIVFTHSNSDLSKQSDIISNTLQLLSPIITAILAYFLLIQIKNQKKINSARFILEFSQELKTYDYILYPDNTKFHTIQPYTKSDIENMLNYFEKLATFWQDDVITTLHVYQYFYSSLDVIHKSCEIMDILNDNQTKDPEVYKQLSKIERMRI